MRKYQMSHHQKFVVFPTYDGAWIFNTRKFVILLFAHFTFHNLQNKLYYIHTQLKRLRMSHKRRTFACIYRHISYIYCTWWKNEIKKKNWRKMEDIPKRNLYFFPLYSCLRASIYTCEKHGWASFSK